MNKLNSTANKLDIFFRVMNVLATILMFAAAVGLALIGACFLFSLDPEMVITHYEAFDVGFLELEIAPAFAPDKNLVLIQTAINLAMGFVSSLMGRMSIRYIREMLQPMKNGEPFNGIVSINLKKLAKLGIFLGIAANLIQLADQAMLIFLLDLPSLLIGDKITHVGGLFTFDLTFLAISAVLLLLSYIFRYGEELQQLSDETL